MIAYYNQKFLPKTIEKSVFIFLPFFFSLFFILADVAVAQERILPFPITSDQLNEYIAKHEDAFVFFIHPKYKNQMLDFTKDEISKKSKGWDICGQKIPTETEFFEVGRFYSNGILHKLIVFNTLCASMFSVLHVHLNSYDDTGLLLDSLILDNRFVFEDVEQFTSFSISKDEVFIYYYITYVIAPNEMGDLGEPIENPIPELYGHARYKIDNGRFSLIYKTDKIKDSSK